MYHTQLLIANRNVDASDSGTFVRRNPMNGTAATRAAAATIADANDAAAAGKEAFAGWSSLGPNARRALLSKAAGVLKRRIDDFVAAMVLETGSTVSWARFNVTFAAGILQEAASLTTSVTGEVIPSDQPGCFAMSIRRPVGVVLGIAPWNAPVILGVRAIATPLACGNTVILKASEVCPATHHLIGDAMREAGMPAGTVNVVTNAPADAAAVVGALIAHPAIRRVNFTGSTKVGKAIARAAAAHLKPLLLELGGKAPLIILADADIDQAVAGAAFGAYMNSGQICMSTERIIVDERIADEFVSRFKMKISTLVAGDPAIGHSPLGCVVDPSAAANIKDLIEDACSKGARLYQAAAASGTLLSAALLDGVTPSMRIYFEESFGPITTILRVKDDAEAVHIANATEYGLTSAVFSRDVGRALRVAEQIDAGMCHINGATVHDEPQMPFGGTKHSGYGRFGGRAGIVEFTELKWITIATGSPHYPI
jgi:acyl-CoA reductase-like NAD-dependent aldehyde dehydrogenase